MVAYPLSAKDVNDPDAVEAINDLDERLRASGGGGGGQTIDRVFTGGSDLGLAGVVRSTGTLSKASFTPARTASTVGSDEATLDVARVAGGLDNGTYEVLATYTFDSTHPADNGLPVEFDIGSADVDAGDLLLVEISAQGGALFDPASVLVDGVFHIELA